MDLTFEVDYFNEAGNVCHTETNGAGWILENGNFYNSELGFKFRVCERLCEFGTWIEIPASEIAEKHGNLLKNLTVIVAGMERSENDGGMLLLPFDSGMLCRTSGKTEAEYIFPIFGAPDTGWTPWWANMPIWGQYGRGKGVLAIAEGGKFDLRLRLRTCWGSEHIYRIDPVFMLRDYRDEDILNDDISMLLSSTDGNYQSMAIRYREYNRKYRKLPSLREKVAKGNAALDYSSQALTVRCRMAVKPLPTQVFEQTPATAPKPKVYMTFDNISTIAKEFAIQQVGPSEFCLVGWNFGGHDGAFPQLFPVETGCGGEAELKKTIDSVDQSGYPLSLHDNYFDGYTLAENFDFDDVCCEHDDFRTPVRGGGPLSGGRAYRVCAEKAAKKYASVNIPEVAKRFNIKGAYFSDVISIISMCKCYHPQHPVNRRQNANYYKKIMKLEQDTFGVSMSEGARDWALPELDRTYMVFNIVDNQLPFVDECIPFYQIAYHGFIIYNNTRVGINTWPGEDVYLLNFAWGGLPMVYFHHIFNPSWGNGDGWNLDLTFESHEKLSTDVSRIKKITDDIARIAPLRYEFIDGFIRHSQTLAQTVYSNGKSVWVNYGDTEVKTPEGKNIPAKDFIVV